VLRQAILVRMSCDLPRPPAKPPHRHPVYGALGARPEETLIELGLRREDIPWRGIALCPRRCDLFD
jgi:hypothetical protein